MYVWPKIFCTIVSFCFRIRNLPWEGPIGREIKTTVRIRWSFMQMCCAASLVFPLIVSHPTCQFWERSEHINMPRTIESPAKCEVRAVIRFLYSEQAMRNVIRHCPSSWQCLAAHCICNKEAPMVFSMGSVWSPTIQSGLDSLWFSCLSLYETVIGGQHYGTDNELQTRVENWLKAQTAGFYDEHIRSCYHARKNVYVGAVTM